MKRNWRPVLFVILNLLFILILAVLIYGHVLTYQHKTDAMGLLLIIPADVAFIVIGTLLLILGESFRIPLLNKLLPFFAIPGFTVPTFILGTVLAKPGYTWEPAYLISAVTGAVLLLLALVTTVTTLLVRKGKSRR